MLEFRDGAEGIAGAVDEERGRAQVGEMLGALLLGLARGMQRVGEQQQRRELNPVPRRRACWIGVRRRSGRRGNGCASFDSPRRRLRRRGKVNLSHSGDGVFQTGAVAGSVAGAGRAEGSGLAIGQVAAQDGETGGGESFSQSDQQGGLGVGAGAVGEDEAVAVGSLGRVQVAADFGSTALSAKARMDGGTRPF